MFSFLNKEPLYHYHMDRVILKSPMIYRNEHKIVHIGGGPNRNHPQEINLNIVEMENVDIVARAEELPFDDESIDVIISNAVLEHVEDINAAISEIKRVLKPGGLVYIEVPFVQYYHTHDSFGVAFEDYRRFSKPGLIKMFDFCVPIDVGVCVGPTSSLMQVLYKYFDAYFVSSCSKNILKKIYYFIGNMVIGIDGLLSKEIIKRSTIPAGIYFFGMKRDEKTAFLENNSCATSIFPMEISAKICFVRKDKELIIINILNTSSMMWVKNSPFPWGTVNIGIQKKENGQVLKDFKRASIPQNILPSESFEHVINLSELNITSATGIIIDLVIEGVCWFGDYTKSQIEINNIDY